LNVSHDYFVVKLIDFYNCIDFYFDHLLLLTGRSYGAFGDFYFLFLLTGRSYGAFRDFYFLLLLLTGRSYGAFGDF